MKLNILKLTLRLIQRNKVYSFINITGLSVGMACCILIFLYVQEELSFDRFHDQADFIYRTAIEFFPGDEPVKYAVIPGPVAPALKREFPEIIDSVRFWHENVTIRYDEKSFNEEHFYFSDPSVFGVFTFPLITGNPDTALSMPFQIVITESAALKYFGEIDPIGKTLTVDIDSPYEFIVTGIMKDIPSNSHLKCDFLVSMYSLGEIQRFRLMDWRNAGFYTYLLIRDYNSVQSIENKFPAFLERHVEKTESSRMKLFLQPLKKIHLYSHLEGELEANSDIGRIYLFVSIALLILISACINFMNLSIAQSASRARGIGLRKVFGASQLHLFVQFLAESAVYAFFSLCLALCIVEIGLPGFNVFTGKNLQINYSHNYPLIISFMGLLVFADLAAGFYPALTLSKFKSSETYKSMPNSFITNAFLRKIFVITQFSVSIILIIVTALIHNQINYLENMQLGFKKEHIVVLPMREKRIQLNYELLKQELTGNEFIINASASSHVPFGPLLPHRVEFQPEGMEKDKFLSMFVLFVDQDFLDTYGIELLEGRNFNRIPQGNSYILNETAVKACEWDEPIEKKISHWIPQTGTVIGVMKDFHFMSLHHEIEPLVLFFSPRWFQYFSIRIQSANMQGTLTFIEDKWHGLFPLSPFEYSFIDKQVGDRYFADSYLVKIFGYFSLLALFIACIGLFGLTSLMIERRTREIGIRKSLGASAAGIIILISKEFIGPLIAANIIAWPITYVVIRIWQKNFAYNAEIRYDLFVAGSLSAILISFITISYRTIKAAYAQPIDSLRYE
ncbi:MAG: ABC transporter permease [Candidatus Latescibacteria bacterium]|nr:ABC transporter permease [Candidatus Latescibacterota bacterium]